MHKDSVKNFAIFCYNYFENRLALITFAKNFGFLADAVSKIFPIENALQPKNRFSLDAFGKSCLLHHLTIAITPGWDGWIYPNNSLRMVHICIPPNNLNGCTSERVNLEKKVFYSCGRPFFCSSPEFRKKSVPFAYFFWFSLNFHT